MSNIAYKSRDILKIKYRKYKSYFYRAIRKISKKLKSHNNSINNIMVFPKFQNEKELKKFINKLLWYLPENEYLNFKINILYDKKFNFSNLKNLTFDNQANFYNGSSNHINIIKNKKEINKADLILIHKSKGLLNPMIWPQIDKTVIVDENFYSTMESGTYSSLLFQISSKSTKNNLFKTSKENFNKLISKNENKNKSYVFCTGPSVEKAYNYNFKDGFNIICNSMVKNKDLMKYIQPELIVFADPVFHFGPSNYAEKFRELMIEAVNKFNLYIVIPFNKAPLFLSHYPEFKERLIIPKKSKNFNFPQTNNLTIKGTDNILTLFMLPFASSITDEIYLLGCDGRKKDEKYFWDHNPKVQFEDLKKTVFKTHPSFFRDRVYQDYYKKHCNTLEKLLQYGEKKGKKYYSLTKSYIPALKKRKF